MKTTLTQRLKAKAKRSSEIQLELSEQHELTQFNKSLSRFTNSFENVKELQKL
jgi:hypothetical protein